MVELKNNSLEEELEKNYLLDKTITDMYNIKITKDNVEEYIKEYKIARVKSFNTIMMESLSSSNYETDKVFVMNSSKEGKFEKRVDDILDSETFANTFDKVSEKLKEKFTRIEKKYFELCLLSNYSEEYCRTNFSGGLSVNGFIPVKNSCILKIALAFGLEVLKWLVNNLYIVC